MNARRQQFIETLLTALETGAWTSAAITIVTEQDNYLALISAPPGDAEALEQLRVGVEDLRTIVTRAGQAGSVDDETILDNGDTVAPYPEESTEMS